jgi:integrase
MATHKERINADGTKSYYISCSLGRDVDGKQIRKYTTWTPAPGMTEKQIMKQLEREKTLFEEACKNGTVLDAQMRFADLAELWLDAKRDSHSPGHQRNARDLLQTINAALGHLRVADIRPHHLQAFYKNLGEPGIKKTPSQATAQPAFGETIKKNAMTQKALAAASGLSLFTVSRAQRGETISEPSAAKIAAALDLDVRTLFDVAERKETLAPRTVLYYHQIIGAVLEYGVRNSIVNDNPARRVEPPKNPKKEAAFLDDVQLAEFVAALDEAPLKWKVASMMLIYSGMRRGEMLGLTWDDVSFANQTVSITKASQYLSGRGVFTKKPKNKSSERVVKLPEEMFDMLQEYRLWQMEERQKYGDRWQDSNCIFTNESGGPMHPDSLSKWLVKFREERGLPYFTVHSLRHSSATLLIMQGVNIRTVAGRLGHSSAAVTSTIYSHAIKSADAAASDVIGDVLRPAVGKPRKKPMAV